MRKEDTSPQGKIITGQLIFLCCEERKQLSTKNLMKWKASANSCEFLWVPASSCEFLWVPANQCEFLRVPANHCEYQWLTASSSEFFYKFLQVFMQVHASSSMFSMHRKIKWNVTEILQHLHACNSNTEVFYGREAELKILKQYFQGPCNKPFVLYGKGGSGKTAMLSIAASKGLQEWFSPGKPLLIIRYRSFQLYKLIPAVDCIVFCLTQNYCYRLRKGFEQKSVDKYI